ncbi:MAG: helix-turn-helix transcriptional regulator [SAR324 cluster bacterium]|nr:helix-turn-helix transcriptional regulator [SAR324 cluster bacterium]
MAKLNEMIQDFRLSINQSVEALAMMLQLTIEEYESLEKDWIPPDEALKEICTLFEWNYNDIKRIARNSPAFSKKEQPAVEPHKPSSPKPVAAFDFHSMLRDARQKVGQSPEGIAMLLNIAPDYYESFEQDKVPSDDLLRNICSLFSWNYREVRRQVINRSTPRMVAVSPPLSLKEVQAKLPKKDRAFLPAGEGKKETLASRLYKARMDFGQNPDGISLLLDISEDYYLEIEAGKIIPDPEMLKRIASLFHWNYNELRLLVHNENIHRFQPVVTELNASSPLQVHKLQALQEEIKKYWTQIQPEKQEMLLAQLEVIRDTAKRWQTS